MITYKHALILVLSLTTMLLPSAMALPADKQQAEEQRVENRFAPLFEAITEQLSTRQAYFMADPVAYHLFIDRHVRSLWDTESTTSALIGKAQFMSLSPQNKQALIAAVDNTLLRYAFEGLEYYGGQAFEVVDVAVNQTATLGWVQVLMESPIIPDLHLDLLIKRTPQGQWSGVDVRFKGIAYVSIKKHEFREIIEQQGMIGLIESLEAKNSEFFKEICALAPATLKGNAPC